MSDFIIKNSEGIPVFIGQEDKDTPPVNTSVGESSKIECPVCHDMFDYLVGEDTQYGGIRGCEVDWKPSTKQEGRIYEKNNTSTNQEILID